MTAGRIGCLILLWPLVDLLLLIIAASIWGWQPVALIILISLILGLIVIRWAISATGRSLGAAMRTLQQRQVIVDPETSTVIAIESASSEEQGALPAPPAATILLIPAGIALAIPGFISDLVGLVLLIPGVRTSIAARWARRMGLGGPGGYAGG